MASRILLAAAVLALTSPAFAHVTLETSTATPGAGYKAVLRVPHGCAGAATTAIRVAVPEGFLAARPMPKPGWTIELKSGDYKQSYQLFGSPVSSGVVEVDWTGGSLPDAYYDEFVLSGQVAGNLEPGKRLYFPVVQECGAETERWIMIPADGESAADLKTPAPSVLLTEKATGH